MNGRMLDRILLSTAEIRAVNSGKRNGKYFFTHSLEQSKFVMKKCFRNLIISKNFFFFVFILLHLFVQNTSISDERNIYGKLQLSFTYSRKLADKGKTPRSRRAAANGVKKNNVSAPSLEEGQHLQNKEDETGGSGKAGGDSANVKVDSSGEAETRSDTATPTSNATTSDSDVTVVSSVTAGNRDTETGSGDSSTSSGKGTSSDGTEKVMRSCLKKRSGTKKEKRKVHFADPLVHVNIFCVDESIWPSDEEEEMENYESYIIWKKKKKKKRILLFNCWKQRTLKIKAWGAKWMGRGTVDLNKATERSVEEEEPVYGVLRRTATLDNLSL
ncbi:Plasmodium exported protein, unknown function [Plasmodium knowlesi strain H]|uniref:Uncharacterized protein n=3 Tax=Plasmodium knowlesi TaxID=5850 RepID=A0A5K1TU02_PLAKH|nr:Plasmodium exported protein, unknown function [Plasmodium knowlesi strain H]OTN67789.1 Uncharacterized protein PKNOH_S05370600 [Plasmodium knowlesi]CAA9990297.1 Plasmodium exported protein, unknown function [Plasmodium knowlesi strain H]SBO19503.1 Plasmodium exported protein, unknown function [Plasmodium knowlesi strain H]VVS79771.1 Plasmodium exported protein, unknown function [Plasmodium knowlesi strain H]|eukprot:XP_002260697.1 hypothetical protein, conserved in Plasmodium species [Plasmodium knowlesi strain H]